MGDYPLPPIKTQVFLSNGAKMGGSHIGNRTEAEQMLKLAAEKDIHPIIETRRIGEEACSECVQKVDRNEVRYRFTLTGFGEVFGTA